MHQKAIKYDPLMPRNSIDFVFKSNRLKNAQRVIAPSDNGATRQFISKNPRLHVKAKGNKNNLQ